MDKNLTYAELEEQLKLLRNEIEVLKEQKNNSIPVEIFNSTNDAIFIHDALTGVVLDVNERAVHMYGFQSKKDLLEQSVGHVSADEEPFNEHQASYYIQKTISDGPQIFEWIAKKASGETFWVEVALTCSKIENNDRIIAVVRDISERKINEDLRKKAEEKLIQKTNELDKFFNLSPDLLCIADTNGFFRRLSPSWQKTLGFTKDELANKKFMDFVHPDDVKSTIDAVSKLSAQIEITNFVNRYRCKNGTYRWIEWHSFPSGELIYAVARDITERKNFEVELLKAKERAEESDQLKTAFLQNMSHEIRTPMNAIIGFSDLLQNEDISQEKRKNYISVILHSSNQLLSIVNDVLTISAIDANQTKIYTNKVCVNDVLKDLFDVFNSKLTNPLVRMSIKINYPDRMGEIFTDGMKLNQILGNLVSNAIKFTHEGFIEIGYSIKKDFIEFYVKDTGIGINPEMHEIIFERFRQVELPISQRAGGTGLGLAISRAFVEMLEGKIWVESEKNKGSVFYFTLPYNPANLEINTKNTEIENFEKGIVLIAEDEDYNYLYLEELIRKFNVGILRALNGKEAVDFCIKNNDIVLVLMDIKMPVLDGHSAACIIKKQKPDLPIIAQSAYALQHEVEQFRKEGFDDYITKPVKKEILRTKLLKYLKN